METKASDLKGMETRLKDLAAKISELESEVHKKNSEVKMHMEQVSTLRAKHKTAHEMLQQIEEATHEELNTLKSGWEGIVTDIQAVLNKIASSY